MKRLTLVVSLLVVCALVIVVKATGQSKSDKSLAEHWEYLVVAGPGNTNFSPTDNSEMRKTSGGFAREGFVLEQHLDGLGAKGWELVSVAGSAGDPIYYFKRRK